jgi:hypothetical protein
MDNKRFFIYMILFSLLIFNLLFIKSLDTNTTDQKAIAWLKTQVSGKCNNLNSEEKIFSLLSIGECKSELKAESADKTCWPGSSCNVKTSAEAIIALKNSGESTIEAENWLLNQTIPFKALNWYLQVDTENKSKCSINYDGEKHQFSVSEEQLVSSGGLGSCFSVYDSYWLKISSSCLDKEFSISCDVPFSTSLLFKKVDSDYFFIPLNTHFAQSEGTTTEKVKSYCVAEQGTSSCNYESTLWTALALNFVGRNSSTDYLAYLISYSDQNQKYLPESILYILTGNYKDDLLNKQTGEGYWQVSNDKFYDTALALLPFQNDDSLSQKVKSKSWLDQVQQKDGSWRGDIKDTGFLIYSLWSRKVVPTTSTDCRNAGYYCLTNSASCSEAEGSVLSNYNCASGGVCCTKDIQKTCAEKSGIFCYQNQTCSGQSVSSSDSDITKVCCVGTCRNQTAYNEGNSGGETNGGTTERSQCEKDNGVCRTSCSSNEKQISSPCYDENDLCCIQKEKSSILLILIIGILILLVIFGFIFKDKLRIFLFPILSKIWKKKNKNQLINNNMGSSHLENKRIPLTNQNAPSSRVYPGAIQRRIIIPENKNFENQRIVNRKETNKNSQEVEDVLKKLKDISK